jgi:polyisoprenoid-binding protein YceI
LRPPRLAAFSRPGLLYSLAIGALLLLAPSTRAQTQKVTVRFDPAATEIHWTLSGNTHTTHGAFKLKTGLVTFDPATGVAEGELLVDLATGESGNKNRDAKMQGEVLQSDKYPDAFFHPTLVTGAVKPGSSQTVSVGGSFNIHGADHPLKMDVQVAIDGDRATATTHFSVPYVAWGMKDPSSFLLRVGKDVTVDIVAHGTVEGVGAK